MDNALFSGPSMSTEFKGNMLKVSLRKEIIIITNKITLSGCGGGGVFRRSVQKADARIV